LPEEVLLPPSSRYDRPIATLTEALERLQSLATAEELGLAEATGLQEVVQTLQIALREVLTIDLPPIPSHIPEAIQQRIAAAGVPLADPEIREVLQICHLSQIEGVLAEMALKDRDIRRKREYFLVRLPDFPVERLGSRLPVYTAADFTWNEKNILAVSEREQLKKRYGIDRLASRNLPTRAKFFDRLDRANQVWQDSQSSDISQQSIDPSTELGF
jgi:hypothetical protein